VSALQHAYVFVLMATFSPAECLIGPTSYLPRAAPNGMEPHADFGLLRHFGKEHRCLAESPVPLFESLSNGTGAPSHRRKLALIKAPRGLLVGRFLDVFRPDAPRAISVACDLSLHKRCTRPWSALASLGRGDWGFCGVPAQERARQLIESK